MNDLTKESPIYYTRFRDTELKKIRVRNGYPKFKHGFPYPLLSFDQIPGIELMYLEDLAKWQENYIKEPYPSELVAELKRRGILLDKYF